MNPIQIKKWLAKSPYATAFKVALGAGLVWLLDNVASLNLPVVVQVAITAGLPVLINYFNSSDPRYGKGSI